MRRLVVETYGSLEKLPILGYLWIDTDKNYKLTNPEASGPDFKDNERWWARVTGKEAEKIVENMENYPWIHRWFPTELQRNLTSLEAGAGQIRACGRFAYFVNYHQIRDRFNGVLASIRGRETYMQEAYNVKVAGNAVNVFVTGSLSGGTGSGMLIDLGYGIREWTKGEGSVSTTAVVPMPNAFASIQVGDRVLSNGYAALMELNYFSDNSTEYHEGFGSSASSEIRERKPPFDFTYLVGTKNDQTNFKLEGVREMIAQHIFLDMTSEFAPHKRSIRDNIKGSWAQADPGGRGYPKNFMSFGLSTVEIPITQIRASLGSRLAADLAAWWLNDRIPLPPNMRDLVQGDLLKRMRLTDRELLADLAAAGDRSYTAVIAEWINQLRNKISTENLLECTQQGTSLLSQERGKVLRFNEYLSEEVNSYRAAHLRDSGTDERSHGDFLTRMYGNRNEVIIHAQKALEAEFYAILNDRTRGPKFAEQFIILTHQVLDDAVEKFRREQERPWGESQKNRRKQFEAAMQQIVEFRDKYGVTKQSKMEEFLEDALTGLEGELCALIQRKSRELGLAVIVRVKEQLTQIERRMNRFVQRVKQMRDSFAETANRQAESADALTINGIKLFDRQELNTFYDDFLDQLAGAGESSRSRRDVGLDNICGTLSDEILRTASPLWKDTRQANEVMQLWDLTEIPSVLEEDLREVVRDHAHHPIANAPQSSRLYTELAACDYLFRIYPDDSDIKNNLRIAFNQSQPLILLSEAVMRGKDAGFTPQKNVNVAILGGAKTPDPAAQRVLKILPEFVGSEDNIKPLGDPERHRIIFVQEIGGFSLRSIEGMRDLRTSYHDWLGEMVEAKRARLIGESRDLPIPVHLQKEAPFWDVFPEDQKVFQLVIQARALEILRRDVNRATQEQTIRYDTTGSTGTQSVDLAATWDEVVQVLEVKACYRDREEVQRQVTSYLNDLKTPEARQTLYQKLMVYLRSRALELDAKGGRESPEYRREDTVIAKLIAEYRLKSKTDQPNGSANDRDRSQGPSGGTSDGSEPLEEEESFSQGDLMGQLERLAKLHAVGALSDQEFQAAKQKLLDL
ncbi:MAG: tubulin-like doman-containing protein [Cyanophyceae cyanobacterium]